MAGTIAGGIKAAQKNLERNPNFYEEIGSKGGKAKVPKGFVISGLAAAAGAKGGRISRRRKQTESNT